MSPRRHVRGISDLVVAVGAGAGGGEELSEQAREWSEAEAEVVSPSTVIAACPAGKCDAIRPIPIGRAGDSVLRPSPSVFIERSAFHAVRAERVVFN